MLSYNLDRRNSITHDKFWFILISIDPDFFSLLSKTKVSMRVPMFLKELLFL